MNTIDAIRDSLERHALIPAGAKVVVGVSGGADSVALLHALHQLNIPVTVAHLNHRLRGAESDADEQFVRELAKTLGLPVAVKSVEVQALANSGGLSLEMAARQARHAFFAEFGAAAVVALAHHADDQVETFLLKLARGAGPDGLGGMPAARQVGPLRLIRPMLEIPRTEIIRWLQANGFTWRDDASNADPAFLRNRVRHTILPLLEQELNPGIRESIRRTMEILRAENAWMKQMQGNSQTLAARRRRLRQWLFDHGAEDAGFEAVENILAGINAGEGTTVFELNGQQRVVVEYGVPRFENDGDQSGRPDWHLQIEHGTGWRKDAGQCIGRLPAEASFDASQIGDSPVEVRSVRPGDRMKPRGMAGRRKLQDILTDQKVPRAQRASIPVVVCRNEIIWVPGYRIARGWEVHGAAGKAVHVRIEQKRND